MTSGASPNLAPHPIRHPHRIRHPMPWMALAFVAALTAVVACLSMTAAQPGLAATVPQPVSQAPAGRASLAPMLSAVTPGVVGISIAQDSSRGNPLLADPFFRQFFEDAQRNKGRQAPTQAQTRPAGSGVIVDADRGLVLTNHHVIEHASRITVVLKDRREVQATLIGSDPGTDIAVLRIAADRLTAVPVGNSEDTQIGDFVVAIGNPFGIGQTVTSGIVSAMGRGGISPEGYEDYIQTDAAINPGNSGGALVNLDGELIGINTAILTGGRGHSGNIGIGFAVPMSMANLVMDQILEHGLVRRGHAGVQAIDVTPGLASEHQLHVDEGALIGQVAPNSPAQHAGIRANDIIVAVNGRPVRGVADLRNRLALIAVGDLATLQVVRGMEELTLSLTMAQTEPHSATQAAANGSTDAVQPGLAPGPVTLSNLGMVVAPRQDGGLYVANVMAGGGAQRAGLQVGDLIIAIDHHAGHRIDLLQQVSPDGDVPLLSVLRQGTKLRLGAGGIRP